MIPKSITGVYSRVFIFRLGHISNNFNVCKCVYLLFYSYMLLMQVLHTLIIKLLQKANTDGMTSVAIPAIGTGNLGFPRDIVAKEMFESVAEFSQNNKGSSLQDIRFWVYDQDAPTIQV